MSVELNSQLPYEYKIGDDYTYRFTTDNGIQYVAYFIDYSGSVGFGKVYSFSFDPEDDRGLGRVFDKRISITIIKILSEFFKFERNSMVMVCDSSDDKQNARSRLFDQWYQKTQIEHRIEKFDFEHASEEQVIKARLYINESNPDKEGIRDSLQNMYEAMM